MLVLGMLVNKNTKRSGKFPHQQVHGKDIKQARIDLDLLQILQLRQKAFQRKERAWIDLHGGG